MALWRTGWLWTWGVRCDNWKSDWNTSSENHSPKIEFKLQKYIKNKIKQNSEKEKKIKESICEKWDIMSENEKAPNGTWKKTKGAARGWDLLVRLIELYSGHWQKKECVNCHFFFLIYRNSFRLSRWSERGYLFPKVVHCTTAEKSNS